MYKILAVAIISIVFGLLAASASTTNASSKTLPKADRTLSATTSDDLVTEGSLYAQHFTKVILNVGKSHAGEELWVNFFFYPEYEDDMDGSLCNGTGAQGVKTTVRSTGFIDVIYPLDTLTCHLEGDLFVGVSHEYDNYGDVQTPTGPATLMLQVP